MPIIRLICFVSIAIFALSSQTVKAEESFCQQQHSGYYHFNSKISLKDNIQNMTKRAGWQLVWRYPADLPVLANSAFKGVLFCGAGVLDRVISSISETGNFGAIGIAFDSRNKVVLVTDNPRALNQEASYEH